LLAAADSLSEFAERGRPTHGGIRELTALSPYLIRYRIAGDTVFILRVRHGAQRPNR
jgi:plasmid stabilization system protein ParE